MSNFLPQHATKYLVESLNKRTTKNINLELAEALKSNATNKSTPSFGPGSGKGVGEQETDTSKSLQNILVGSKTKSLIPDNDPMREMLGLYTIGKVASTGSDILDMFGAQKLGSLAASKLGPLGQIGGAIAGKAISAIPGVGSSLLRQISDISGAGWVDAQIGNIGPSELKLAAQGAGSPWTPFVLPGQAKSERKGYDPNKETDDAIKAASRAEQIKKLRAKGYSIP
jgi:hypothetical protein